MMGTTIKNERHDDAEINEMARRIMEQNRAKMTQPGMPPMGPGYPGMPGAGPMQMARPGQPMIQNYMANNQNQQNNSMNNLPGSKASTSNGTMKPEKALDEDSRKGRFGWAEFEKTPIPFIFRASGEKTEKYISVRMVERKLLHKFLNVLPTEVNSCHCIRSYYITDHEAKLLNEINIKHADLHFGKEAFTTKDLVVRMADAKEFYKFLDLCYKKLVLKRSNASDRCGFFRINRESVVPYTVKENVKYVPLFYFEGETDHLKLKSDKVDGWDLAYLKFCCKVQGIRNELFAADTCRVVALEEIKGHFPSGTTFEDYWPAKGSIEPVQHTQRVSAGNWTQKPVSVVPQNNQQGGQPPPPPPAHQARPPQPPSASTQQATQNNSASMNSNQAAMANYAQQLQAAAVAAQRSYSEQQMLQQMMRSAQQANASAASAAMIQQQQRMLAAYAGLPGNHSILGQSAAAATQRSAQQQQPAAAPSSDKQFNGKLTQIKEFPMEQSHQPPYKLQKALIDQKIVPCINVRPYVFHDLMMTLPDFVKHFYPDLTLEKARQMLQDILKVVLYKGNSGHQEILRAEGKCNKFDPVPLVLVKDIMNYMPQMKYMFANVASSATDSAAKRQRLS